MIDIKTAGLSQDLKELKKDKGFEKRLSATISKIKSEGKAREQKYKEEYPKRVLSKSEKQTITSPKEYAKYKKQVKDLQQYDSKKGNWKTKAYTIASRIETGANVALENITSKLGQKLKQRVISRKVLKPSQMSVTIPNYKAESVLGDPNRFFKQELEETKQSLFFS